MIQKDRAVNFIPMQTVLFYWRTDRHTTCDMTQSITFMPVGSMGFITFCQNEIRQSLTQLFFYVLVC